MGAKTRMTLSAFTETRSRIMVIRSCSCTHIKLYDTHMKLGSLHNIPASASRSMSSIKQDKTALRSRVKEILSTIDPQNVAEQCSFPPEYRKTTT